MNQWKKLDKYIPVEKSLILNSRRGFSSLFPSLGPIFLLLPLRQQKRSTATTTRTAAAVAAIATIFFVSLPLSFFGDFPGTTWRAGGKCWGGGARGSESISSGEGDGSSGASTGGLGFGDGELEAARSDGAGPLIGDADAGLGARAVAGLGAICWRDWLARYLLGEFGQWIDTCSTCSQLVSLNISLNHSSLCTNFYYLLSMSSVWEL
jgi:hypothetical protein